MVILWERNTNRQGEFGNVFYKMSPDRKYGMEVHFKRGKHVTITAWTPKKRRHEELHFRYGRAPHIGMLEKACELFVEICKTERSE